MTVKLRPLNTRIIIPDNAKTKKAMGTVVAMGPGMLMKSGARWPMPAIEPGGRVVYSKYAGVELTFDGVLYIVVRDDDCMAGGPDDKHLKPLMDRVLVRVDEAQKKIGSIIIPDIAQEKPLSGEVIAVGQGKAQEDGSLRPLDVKVGERIRFMRHQGFELTVGGENFMVFHEDDLLGIVSGE